MSASSEPFQQKKTRRIGGVLHYRFACPNCGAIKEKRKDSFLIGLHVLICVPCGYTSSAVMSNGARHAVTDEDHRGGGPS